MDVEELRNVNPHRRQQIYGGAYKWISVQWNKMFVGGILSGKIGGIEGHCPAEED